MDAAFKACGYSLCTCMLSLLLSASSDSLCAQKHWKYYQFIVSTCLKIWYCIAKRSMYQNLFAALVLPNRRDRSRRVSKNQEQVGDADNKNYVNVDSSHANTSFDNYFRIILSRRYEPMPDLMGSAQNSVVSQQPSLLEGRLLFIRRLKCKITVETLRAVCTIWQTDEHTATELCHSKFFL